MSTATPEPTTPVPGSGIQVIPHGRTARLVDESGVLVATGDTAIDDDVVFALIEAGRR